MSADVEDDLGVSAGARGRTAGDAAQASVGAEDAASLRVLHLEDVPLDAELVCGTLTQAGLAFKADVVASREDFIAALGGGVYDIILADYKLPGFDAHAALRLAQERCPTVPVIVVSGTIGEETAVALLKQGATDYVIKDRLERLPSAVRRALDEAVQRQAQLQAEQALRESEERHRRITDMVAAYSYSFRVGQDGTLALEWISEGFDRATGFTPEESEARGGWASLLHPDDRGIAAPRGARLLRGESDVSEFRIVTKSGEERWLRDYAQPEWDDGERRVVRIRGAAQVVTERKQAEEALAAGARRLRATLHDTVRAMGAIIDLRDRYTGDHQRRVARLAEAMAAHLGLDADRREGLRMAAEAHDVGKIGVPAEILSKPAKLTDVELSLVRQHAVIGREILSTVTFDWPVAEIVGQHHERLDGSGYPDGLQGTQILLEARILGVADVVEAMASHRPYRPALGIEAALDEVRDGAGTRYDADAVAACQAVFAGGFALDAPDEAGGQ